MTVAGSFVVHYPELALKGRNRPWFVDTLLRHLRAVLRPVGARRGACHRQPHRGRPLCRRLRSRRARAPSARLRRRELRPCVACAPTLDAILDARRDGAGTRGPGIVSREGPPRRQAVPAAVSRDRAARRASGSSSAAAGASISSAPALTVLRGSGKGRGVLHGRARSRARRAAGGLERERGVPVVGRHRLARRRVADDAEGVPGARGPLPQPPADVGAPRRTRCAG